MEKPGFPKVSVIVAAYNEERHISECLKSLTLQTYPNVEVIVVDDGSEDSTKFRAREFPDVKVVEQPHLGPHSARNRGAGLASGDIFMFVDADQWFDPKFLEELALPITAGRCLGTCPLTEKLANGDNLIARCMGEHRTWKRPFSHTFRAIRRDAFERIGGYSDTMGYWDDHSLFQKLGVGSVLIETAVCYHFQSETFRDVFSQAKWSGKG